MNTYRVLVEATNGDTYSYTIDAHSPTAAMLRCEHSANLLGMDILSTVAYARISDAPSAFNVND